ncbi:hypothetical protein [Natroniella sp. ANB-PHB2]|uniref:hypothetical protein n=1 Tax=Natroniella sp. ANB-PHB2 TaxID=3384444 RepID=UPI0038D43A11
MNEKFKFSIAVAPNKMNLDTEIKYIKSALLYADTITLISPIAYIYFQLTDEKYKQNERQAVKLIDKIAPFIRIANPEVYRESEPIINQFKEVVLGKQYKNLKMVKKLHIRRGLNNFASEINNVLEKSIGSQTCKELSLLVNENKVELANFNHSFDDIDGYVREYFNKLKDSINSSYPLFDNRSNKLLSTAIKSGVIDMSRTKKYKTIHAGVADNLLTKLPSFEFASVNEILDIRRELGSSLIRFRSKILEFAEVVQSLPWNEDFEDECYILYNKKVAPSLLEIEELINENNIIKNLGIKILTDQKIWDGLGGLVINIAAAGAISSLSDTITSDTAIYTASGAWALNKIANTYNDYSKKTNTIKRKDLFFYYKAGKMLKNKYY